MCDIAGIRLTTRNKRYRRYHWKLSIRPIFKEYKFTTPHPLTKSLSLVPNTVGYENSRLITKTSSETVAEVIFDRNACMVKITGKEAFNVGYDRRERAFVFRRGEFKSVARRVRCGSRVLVLEWGIQKLRIVPVHAYKKHFVVSVVEQNGRPVKDMKVIEFERTSLEETFDVRSVGFAKLELIACIAWLIIIVNR